VVRREEKEILTLSIAEIKYSRPSRYYGILIPEGERQTIVRGSQSRHCDILNFGGIEGHGRGIFRIPTTDNRRTVRQLGIIDCGSIISIIGERRVIHTFLGERIPHR
jgi:hypothetical protein